MKIRIVQHQPIHSNDGDITKIIGREFDVIDSDDEGVWIKYGSTNLYHIYHGEYEQIEYE